MYHSFFIYSSVDGHLGCFCVLAIVNSAAMKQPRHGNIPGSKFWFPHQEQIFSKYWLILMHCVSQIFQLFPHYFCPISVAPHHVFL